MTKRATPFPFLLAVAVAGVTVACGGGSSSVNLPDMPAAAVSPVGGATIAGTVLTGGTASGGVGASSVSGLRVSVSGTGLRTTTDGSGRFTLAGVPTGRAELRFEGPGIDARLQVESLQSGQTLTITVRVSGNSAAQVSDGDDDQDEVEFEGTVDSVGSGGLVVAGRTVHVDASTRILDSRKVPIPLSSLKPGDLVEVEGTAQPGGSVLARKVKLEGEDDDDDGHGQEVEFEGRIDSVGSGSLVVAGRTVHVDASTRILDSRKLPIPLSGLKPGDLVEVEGTAQPDGSVLARKVKLEGEDDDEGHGQEVEFEGTITVLAPLTIGGRLVTTDGSTRYFGRKKETLTAADVLKIGSRVEVEGFQQPDNSVLAKKIELED